MTGISIVFLHRVRWDWKRIYRNTIWSKVLMTDLPSKKYFWPIKISDCTIFFGDFEVSWYFDSFYVLFYFIYKIFVPWQVEKTPIYLFIETACKHIASGGLNTTGVFFQTRLWVLRRCLWQVYVWTSKTRDLIILFYKIQRFI